MSPAQVVLVEDHTLVRQALAAALLDAPDLDIEIVGQYPDMAPLLERPEPPDLVLLDLDLGGRQVSADQVRAVMERGTRVLVVSALGSRATVLALVDLGVAGFLSKRESTQTLTSAVAAVLAGGTWTTPELAGILVNEPAAARPALSPQEQRVLALYASGMRLETVARQLAIQPGTVRAYLERIRAKYDAAGRATHSKAEMYQQGLRDGFIQPPE